MSEMDRNPAGSPAGGAPGAAPTSPQVLNGRYEIHRRLARGGMAEVFLARDSALDRPVAVKMLFPEFAADPAFVERFRREAQAAANLAHPNIVGVYDWGSENGTYFIVMEYVDGQSLAEVIRAAGPLHPRRAAEICFEIAGALGFAHQRGVVHRDVKPGNVLISSSGVAKMTDFGIARALSSPSEDLTQAGSVMGTATYFSPEQAQGFNVDARSDLYSLGVVLYETICGRPPFTGESPVAIAYKHVQESPPPPSRFVSGVPVGIEAVVLKLLSKNPENRYLSADDLRADLRRFLDGVGTHAEHAVAQVTGAVSAVPGALGSPDPDATRVAQAVTVAAPAPSAPVEPPAVPGPPADEYDEPPRRTGLFLALLAILLVALGVLVFWLIKSLNDDGTNEVKVEVPSVINLSAEDAKAQIVKAGLTANPVEVADPNAPAGIVFEQDPPAKSQVAKGTAVTLKVSTGPPPAVMAKVPKVVGLSEADAKNALLSSPGKFQASVEQVPGTADDVGKVVSQDPAENVEAPEGSPVKIRVSKGPDGIAIPPVAGKTPDQAKKLLTDAGFKVASTNIEQASPTVPKGQVITTNPEGSAKKNDTVTLVVSSGPEQVTVPALKGKTDAEATSILQAANIQFIREFKTLPAGDPNIGRVVEVSPASGTKINPANDTVTVTLGAASSGTPSSTTPPSTTTSTAP